MGMNETIISALEEVIPAQAVPPTDTSVASSGSVSSTGKLALLAKAGKTDMLLLTLLAAEFGPQITTGLSHVPGCG